MITDSWKNATPEQINLWKYAKGLIAYNTITPIYYSGLIAGSEFLTYAATKLYVCLSLHVSFCAVSVNVPNILIYNEANVAIENMAKFVAFWDATAAAVKYTGTSGYKNNFYFGRIVPTTYVNMSFNGYKLTIV